MTPFDNSPYSTCPASLRALTTRLDPIAARLLMLCVLGAALVGGVYGWGERHFPAEPAHPWPLILTALFTGTVAGLVTYFALRSYRRRINSAMEEQMAALNTPAMENESERITGLSVRTGCTAEPAYRSAGCRLHEEQIEQLLKEKEILIREVHHRVKNNLQIVSSLLSLQSATAPDQVALQMFKQCQHRVRAMAMAHEALYSAGNLSELSLSEYVRRLTVYLLCAQGRRDVKVDVEIGFVLIDMESAVPCGLALSELVSNALIHAFPDGRRGRIVVRGGETDQGDLELCVEDDGVGLPPDLDLQKDAKLGLSLVMGLVEKQLGGVFEVRRNEATCFYIRFNKYWNLREQPHDALRNVSNA